MWQGHIKEHLVLASSSPRRKALLELCGLSFEVIVSKADEVEIEGEAPKALVERLSRLKSLDVAINNPEAWVIGADTVVAINGEVLGKPKDKADASRMLNLLQDTSHSVWGSFCVNNLSTEFECIKSFETKVKMLPFNQLQIDRYIASGEPLDKAGAYGIQGRGCQFVSEIRGSYTNVVGLNVAVLMEVLKEQGVLMV